MTRILCALFISAGIMQAAEADGLRIFASTCAACHGLDGNGGEHAPDIATAAKVRALSDEELVKLLSKGIPAAGMPAFGGVLKAEELSAVAGYLRVLQNQTGHTIVSGNGERGKQVFEGKAACTSCHLMNGKGGVIGPDLSSYGKIHNQAEVKQAILEPNRNFDWHHPMAEVSTRNGDHFSGVIRNEDNFSLQLQGLDGDFLLLGKADVREIKRQPQSLMPADYAARLSKSELQDLIAYLITAATGKPSKNEDQDEN